MAADDLEYDIEVLGTCTTNTTKDSQCTATVDPKYLWSFAQEAALKALCERKGEHWYFIGDPERRARRIAANYADLYFRIQTKSNKTMQFYWAAAAAFAVKGIADDFHYARTKVLGVREGMLKQAGSFLLTGDRPYVHAQRINAALAKGNLWLFMEIYPWLHFIIEYGFAADGTLLVDRLKTCMKERDWNTLHEESKKAVEKLPFGPEWLRHLQGRMVADPVYREAKKISETLTPVIMDDSGTAAQRQAEELASAHVRDNVDKYDAGYRMPSSKYWNAFPEAFSVMEAEREELTHVIADVSATARLVQVRNFKATPQLDRALDALIDQAKAPNDSQRYPRQQTEVMEILTHEQRNVLQPLVYEDPKFRRTIDANHQFSRISGGLLTPKIQVVWSAEPETDDPTLVTVFDPPGGSNWLEHAMQQVAPPTMRLWDVEDRMIFAGQVARDFDGLMKFKRAYAEDELRKIRAWLSA